MKCTHSDSKFAYYVDHFDGIEVRFQKDKKTNQYMVNGDDMARCFGYQDVAELLLNRNVIQDIIFGELNNGMVMLK